MPVDVEQLPLDFGDEIELLMRRFYPVAVSQAFGDAANAVGVTVAFDLDNPLVQETLDDLAKQVRSVTETTREEIRALVGKQAAEGWSISELADEIAKLGETNSPRRAELIARTESAAAYSRGSLLAYQESGVVSGTEWLVSDPCPICAALAGKVAELGKEFSAGISHPPAHPGCKCALAPMVA